MIFLPVDFFFQNFTSDIYRDSERRGNFRTTTDDWPVHYTLFMPSRVSSGRSVIVYYIGRDVARTGPRRRPPDPSPATGRPGASEMLAAHTPETTFEINGFVRGPGDYRIAHVIQDD